MNKKTQENYRLFEELQKYQVDTKEYQSIFSKIVLNNEKLIWEKTHQFRQNYGYILEDLFSTGKMGLIKAIKSYDINMGFSFGAYAGCCIENEICMYLRKEKRLAGGGIVPFEKPKRLNSNDSNLTIGDTLSCGEDFEAEILDQEEIAWQRNMLKMNLDKLPPLEAKILKLRYLSGNDKITKQKFICKELNLSQPCVTRIEKRAILHIKSLIKYGNYQGCNSKRAEKEVYLIPKLKKIIKTQLNNSQAQVLQHLYFDFNYKTNQFIANEIGYKSRSIDSCKEGAIKNVLKIYNQENSENKISQEQLIKYLEDYRKRNIAKLFKSLKVEGGFENTTLKKILVSQLTNRQSLITMLIYYAKISRNDIARLLDVKIGNINNNLMSALKNLQKQYNEICEQNLSLNEIKELIENTVGISESEENG